MSFVVEPKPNCPRNCCHTQTALNNSNKKEKKAKFTVCQTIVDISLLFYSPIAHVYTMRHYSMYFNTYFHSSYFLHICQHLPVYLIRLDCNSNNELYIIKTLVRRIQQLYRALALSIFEFAIKRYVMIFVVRYFQNKREKNVSLIHI